MIIDSKFSTEQELCTCDGDSKQLSETGGAVVGGRNGCQKRNKWPIEKFRFNEKFKGIVRAKFRLRQSVKYSNVDFSTSNGEICFFSSLCFNCTGNFAIRREFRCF